MPVDHIRYDLLTQDALRGIMRVVLADAAVKGLPGDHHFFVTFDTRVDGVRLSARLKANYPEEMTIVLQHQFWDLTVREDDFDVGLAFNGIPERLHIPFRAVKAFVDPSVQFGLQFAVDGQAASVPHTTAEPRMEVAKPGTEKPPIPAKPAQTTQRLRPQSEKESRKEPGSKAVTPVGPTPPPAEKDDGSAEVVSLDRFRKK
jgi:uncharacterized protein